MIFHLCKISFQHTSWKLSDPTSRKFQSTVIYPSFVMTLVPDLSVLYWFIATYFLNRSYEAIVYPKLIQYILYQSISKARFSVVLFYHDKKFLLLHQRLFQFYINHGYLVTTSVNDVYCTGTREGGKTKGQWPTPSVPGTLPVRRSFTARTSVICLIGLFIW